MNINIETSKVQAVTSEQLDILAKYLCGVRLTLSDSGVPLWNVDNISIDGINAVSNAAYVDSVLALGEKGVNVTTTVQYQRILDPVVRAKFLDTFSHATVDSFSILEFLLITSNMSSFFKNNSGIKEFMELPNSGINTIGTDAFSGSSIEKIDLSNIEYIYSGGFSGCKSLKYIGSLDNAVRIYRGAFNMGDWGMPNVDVVTPECLKVLTLPNLIQLGDGDHVMSYGYTALPSGMKWLYCPKCEKYSKYGSNAGYAFFPKIKHTYDGGGYGSPWGNHYCPGPNVMKMYSFGPTLETARFNCFFEPRSNSGTVTDSYRKCLIFHGNNATPDSPGYQEGTESIHGFFFPGQLKKCESDTSKYSYSWHLHAIGDAYWKDYMEFCASDRAEELGENWKDEYTDFYYEYMDYLIGGIPVPPEHNQNPTTIKIYDRYEELHDGDDLCDINDYVDLLIYTDSYRNACTITLSDNNANVTLDGHRITIPSTSNGQTVTVTVTSTYNSNVSVQMTFNVYAFANKVDLDNFFGTNDGIDIEVYKAILSRHLFGSRYLPMSYFTGGTVTVAGCLNMYRNNTAIISGDAYAHLAGATTISQDAFNGATNLQSYGFPNTLTTIGQAAFYNCSSLTQITLPHSLTTINNNAFHGAGLTSVTLPNSITSMAGSVFEDCKSLQTVTFENGFSLTNSTIGDYTFNRCSALTQITIPSGITTIGKLAFHGCTALTTVVLPTECTSLGLSTFDGCTNLTTINLDNVTSLNNSTFANCTSLEIQDFNYPNLTNVGTWLTFSKCKIYKISDLGTTQTIPTGCFLDNPLTTVTLSDYVKKIDQNAFRGCTQLSTVEIGTGVQTIGDTVLYNSPNFVSLTIKATTPPSLGSGNFGGSFSNNFVIYVPAGTDPVSGNTYVDIYKAASGWSNYASHIQAIPTT